MNHEIFLKKWKQNLRHKDWYILLEEEIRGLINLGVEDENVKYKFAVYSLIEDMISKEQIPLSSSGPNFDEDRVKIDTIVMHHTGDQVETEHILSAIGLIRQYAHGYLGGDILGYKVYGMPIWSGHFKKDKQVFYPYHWVIFPNGRSVRLLSDNYIGWHAGNWDVNRRSIGIALVGNFELKKPTKKQRNSLFAVIKNYKESLDIKNILGHRLVKGVMTDCPGINLSKII